VRALDVVGEYFEMRFGVDLCTVGENDVAVGLARVGLLAPGRTTMRPLKTARPRSSTTPL